MHRLPAFAAALLPLAALSSAMAQAAGLPACDDRIGESGAAPVPACARETPRGLAGGASLDCNHPHDADQAAASVARAYGVVANGRSDAAVRHCSVRGLRYGLYLARLEAARAGGAAAGTQPSQARALRNMRSHGESPDHSRGAQL